MKTTNNKEKQIKKPLVMKQEEEAEVEVIEEIEVIEVEEIEVEEIEGEEQEVIGGIEDKEVIIMMNLS